MMSRKTPLLVLLLVPCLLVAVSACKKKTEPETIPEPPDTTQQAEPPEAAEPPQEIESGGFDSGEVEQEEMPRLSGEDLDRMLTTVYFAFDQYDLTDETRRMLQANANVLQNNRDFSVVIEGHCDERGTIEYNLALGEKRARAVRDYLVSLGLGAARLRIVSYGEERPGASGHTEAAWAKSRRAEFRTEQ